MSPAQVAEEIRLLQTALVKVWMLGRLMENVAAAFAGFPTTISVAELDQLRNPPDEPLQKLLAPAQRLTSERLKAAGYDTK